MTAPHTQKLLKKVHILEMQCSFLAYAEKNNQKYDLLGHSLISYIPTGRYSSF
jgi:hypothetical protein